MDIVKTINDVEYRFERMKIGDSIVFQATLLKLAGPGLSGAKMMQGVGFLDQDIPSLIGSALSGIDPNTIAVLIEDTIRKMVKAPPQVANGGQEGYESYYSTKEKEAELFEAFYACIEIQTGGTVAWVKKKLQGNGKNS